MLTCSHVQPCHYTICLHRRIDVPGYTIYSICQILDMFHSCGYISLTSVVEHNKTNNNQQTAWLFHHQFSISAQCHCVTGCLWESLCGMGQESQGCHIQELTGLKLCSSGASLSSGNISLRARRFCGHQASTSNCRQSASKHLALWLGRVVQMTHISEVLQVHLELLDTTSC